MRRVRAFNPFPAATTSLQGEVLKVWAAQVLAPDAAGLVGPNTVQDCGAILAVEPTGIAVAAMNSVAVLTALQRPGGKRLAVADFLRGFEVRVEMRMEGPRLPGGSPSAGQSA